MKREWFFDRFCGEQIAVCTEDGRLTDVYAESERSEDMVGNIYKGRVANIVPGMQAAFISCGLERNCYLPLDEGAARFAGYDGVGSEQHMRALREGDELLVQIVKAPRAAKGAKVSCDLSYVGKHLIYLPNTDFLGISRKITDETVREALLKETEKMRVGDGYIVRTAAANATKRQIKIESDYLKRMHRITLEAAREAPVGTIVYRECDLPVRVMRDCFGDEVTRLYVGNDALYEKLRTLVSLRPDLSDKKLVHYQGQRTLFSSYYDLSRQIGSLAEEQISLSNGAYLIIQSTEAMTVIDVNTGKFTGAHDLESTVFETNLLAAREIARQVRLRNVGGIVAVDFIDMVEPDHRQAVEDTLVEALAADRAKSRVFPMNELCVTLFTRKRTSRDLGSLLLRRCPHCGRRRAVYSELYMAMRLRNAIYDYFADGYEAVIIDIERALMEHILSGKYLSEELVGAWRGKRVYFVPHEIYSADEFAIRGSNERVLTLPAEAQILY